jgi:hypothetical protein
MNQWIDQRIGLRRALLVSVLAAAVLALPVSVVLVLARWTGVAAGIVPGRLAAGSDLIGALLVSFDVSVLVIWVPCLIWIARVRPHDLLPASSRRTSPHTDFDDLPAV